MSDAARIEEVQSVRAAARALRDAGDWAGAEALLRQALEAGPKLAVLVNDLSEVLLQARRYAEAWPLHEARRLILPRGSIPPIGGPEWMGGDIAGARVAVCGEQGLGDQIMYGRYLGALQARGAEVVVALPLANLTSLFEHAGHRVRHIVPGELPEGADLWTYCGSLPLRLGVPDPVAARYLEPPLSPSGGGGVGVVATGSPIHWNDGRRSLPVELQDRLGRLGRDLRPQATGAVSMLDTAAIVAGLDLVIAVDTSVAHLALSMGKPTWVVLAHHGCDYRWNDGVRSDWYARARLFRQPAPGDWASVLDEVEAAIADEGLA